MSDTPSLTVIAAVVLAIVAAGGFGVAAFVQQRVVAETAATTGAGGGTSRLGRSTFASLAREPRWLAGWVLFGGASLVHLSALVLAPVSVVQPVGVLAVPVAVLLGARVARQRPSRRVLLGVALSMVGTGVFVLISSTGQPPVPAVPTWSALLTAVLGVGVAAVTLGVWSRPGGRGAGSALVRCLAHAATGAICFGFSSALIRVVARVAVSQGVSVLVVVAGLTAVGALALGAWAVQQAYACGPAAAVVGCLTVGDPLVAILLSAGLFGEGEGHGFGVFLLMIGCAAAAAAGVGLLARHYPAAGAGPDPETTRPQGDPSPDHQPQLLLLGKART